MPGHFITTIGVKNCPALLSTISAHAHLGYRTWCHHPDLFSCNITLENQDKRGSNKETKTPDIIMEVGGEDDDEPDELDSIEEDPGGACSAETPTYSRASKGSSESTHGGSDKAAPRGHLAIRSHRYQLQEPALNEPGLTEQSDDSGQQLGKSPPNWWDRPTYPVQCSEETTDSEGGGAASGHASDAWQTLSQLRAALHTDAIPTQAQSELGFDEEFKELISQAPEAIQLPYPVDESPDPLADIVVGHKPAFQHQLSSADSLKKLEQQLQELEANRRSAHQTAAQTSAEELRRQASQAQQERLRLLRTLDSCQADFSAGNPTSFRMIPKDPLLCCICRREEISIRILECRHAHWCLNCFKKYFEHIRPPRCPVCNCKTVSYEFI